MRTHGSPREDVPIGKLSKATKLAKANAAKFAQATAEALRAANATADQDAHDIVTAMLAKQHAFNGARS
jgi:hypothetical protein